ncbi:MAG: chromosomal replication initiation protein DnaA [Rhodospirillaceae bacterium TMED8]|nr:chromosomal replication initiator protein DnaA [Magnetovibrio sp.]OUT50467.1 MAG: chromosomal replication initiation protein DnaA [Rhodospirillaceae bacterium TMED8]
MGPIRDKPKKVATNGATSNGRFDTRDEVDISAHSGASVGGVEVSADELATHWENVSAIMRAEIGEAPYQSWLRPMSMRGIDGGVLTIAVPTRFMRDWAAAHYQDRLTELWGVENDSVKSIMMVVRSAPPFGDTTDIRQKREAADIVQRRRERGNDLSAPLDGRFTFEQFVVGKPNEFAYAAARRVAEADSVPFNPLFLYGGVGLGKTHLMHAIAWHISQSQPERNVIYLSAEKFMYRFIQALREQNTVDFKSQFRSVDVLMIDDVQFIAGKDSTQEEFFHTFNALVDQGRQIVISADKSPSYLEGMEERLVSRLNCGLVADIHATTYELRLGILQSKAHKLGVEVSVKVLEFLAHKITANVRELEGALNRVVAHAQLVGRDISLETTQDVLRDLLRANDRRVTIEEIQKQVASHFNVRISDMHSARRARSVARPRQVAMYLAKQLTSRSLPEIGRKFGGRDHTTVMHAVRKVEELREHDTGFNEDVELLRRMLEG